MSPAHRTVICLCLVLALLLGSRPRAELAAQAEDWPAVGLAGGPLAGVGVIEVSRDDPLSPIGHNQQVVVGGNLVMISNRGADWTTRAGTGPVAKLLTAPNGVILASGPTGNWRSSNYGRAWTRESVQGDEPARFVAVSPAYKSDGLALAVTTDDWRMYRSDQRSGRWIEVVLKLGQSYKSGAAGFSPEFATDETIFVGSEQGVYRSQDSGQTWTQISTAGSGTPAFGPAGGSVDAQAIVVPDNFGDDPADPYDLDDHTLFAFNAAGLHRSDDAGVTWRRLPLDAGRIRALAISNAWPTDPVLLAAIGEPGLLGAVSYDGGATWKTIPGPAGIAGTGAATAVDFGVPGFRIPPFPNLRGRANLPVVAKKALDRVSYETPYLGTREMILTTDGDGLRRSKDAGATWEAEAPNATLYNVQPTCLAYLPGGAEVLAGTAAAGLYASADGGKTWRWRDTALPRGAGQDLHRLAVSPDFARDRTIFAAAASGVWVSRDAGQTWARTSGPAPARAIALSPTFARDRTLIAAGQLSTDGGATWAPLPEAGAFAWSAAAFSPKFETDRTLWVGRAAAEGEKLDFTLYRSHDAGQTWERIEAGNLRGQTTQDIETVAVAADPIRIFLATERSLFLSQDDGRSWSQIREVSTSAVWDLDSRVLSQPFATAVIAAATTAGVSWSTNRGRDWSSSPRGVANVRALSLSGDASKLVGAVPVAVMRFEKVLDSSVLAARPGRISDSAAATPRFRHGPAAAPATH